MIRRVVLLALLVALASPLLIRTTASAAGGGELSGGTEIAGTGWPNLTWPPDGWVLDTLTPTLRFQSEGYTQLIVAPKASSIPVVEIVLPRGQDTYTIPAPLAAGTAYRWKARSNPYPPSESVYTWSAWSPEGSFTTPGSTSWADTSVVRPVAPPNGTLASVITPTLSWTAPAGSTYYEMVITPQGGVGAGVKLVNKIDSSYQIPGPPSWYGMLPDTTYYWKVRVTNSAVPVPDDHPSWGPWSDTWSFRTPIPPSEVIQAVTPVSGARVQSATPTLTWANPNDQVFYYEVQLSKDPNFVTDPGRAVAPVYWELRHGGLTNPHNSYTVSSAYPLERGQTYYWRVRPAVPQATKPIAWSQTWSFVVP